MFIQFELHDILIRLAAFYIDMFFMCIDEAIPSNTKNSEKKKI